MPSYPIRAVVFRPFNPRGPKGPPVIPATQLFQGTGYRLRQLCGCGCGAIVANVYAQGHDMIAKSKGIK